MLSSGGGGTRENAASLTGRSDLTSRRHRHIKHQNTREDQMNAPADFEPLLDVQTAAKSLSLHPKTVMRMARQKRIPAYRVGRFWFFRASLIDSWLNSQLECGSANSSCA
jgi:excisionase family DNA binding protein